MKPRQILKERKEKADKIAMALGCPWSEAYDMVLEDERVDKMTSPKSRRKSAKKCGLPQAVNHRHANLGQL